MRTENAYINRNEKPKFDANLKKIYTKALSLDLIHDSIAKNQATSFIDLCNMSIGPFQNSPMFIDRPLFEDHYAS